MTPDDIPRIAQAILDCEQRGIVPVQFTVEPDGSISIVATTIEDYKRYQASGGSAGPVPPGPPTALDAAVEADLDALLGGGS